MAMFMPKDDSLQFERPPEGNHLAVCYRVIDLGTQKTEYMGEVKMRRKIMLSWELPTERMQADARPFTISKRYTFSSNEKSSMRKDLESWRGKKFTPQDFGPGGFDIRNVIGKACFMQIVHNEKDGKSYANIASIASLPKGMSTPQLENAPVFFSLEPEDYDAAVLDGLSENLKAAITSSPEYRAIASGKTSKPAADNDAHTFDDEIPF